MKNFLFALLLVPMISFGQNLAPGQNELKTSRDISYHGKDFFSLEGTSNPRLSQRESLRQITSFRIKRLFREPVWDLSKSSAGMSIRFLSNSKSISVKWTILNDLKNEPYG